MKLSVFMAFVLIGCDGDSQIKSPSLGSSGGLAPDSLVSQASQQSSSQEFLTRWDSLALADHGTNLPQEQTKLLGEAVSSLGESLALGEFIKGLWDRREAAVVDRLLTAHKKAMFSGKDAPKVREWVMCMEDGDFKNRLCFEAGYFFTGAGLKEQMGRLSPPAAQERFLAGYCSRLAETDPVRAIQEYKALRSAKMTFYGLLDVMDCLTPDGDFAKADAIFPDDYDEKNNMGAALRQRLLTRWATFHPEAAAKYVADTPKRVKPESVRVVIAKWAETKPEEAVAWLENSGGALRDAGYEELAKQATKAGNHADAWSKVAKIGNYEKKVKEATEVFKAWEKTDKPAATKAWLELFPPVQ